MEYERVHKVQNGIISPSKLRMKLMGRLIDGSKSNSDSSRTSPAKLEDSEFVKNRLLGTQSGDFQHAASDIEVPPIKCSSNSTLAASQGDGNLLQLVSSSLQPMRTHEDEILDYDSTSSFEFHKGERSLHHPANRSFSRPLPSKWNDAEKWIMKQNIQSNNSKKTSINSHVNRVQATESNGSENKLSIKRVDFCQPAFASRGSQPVSVSMRDMGTEMTPIPSQEPSRVATPVGSTTPFRSPTSSLPSTPRASPIEQSIDNNALQLEAEKGKRELYDEEQKLKIRKDIVALGVQLGKTNIAAWASKDEKEKSNSRNDTSDSNKLEEIEYAKRAAAWEEAEKSKHASRFKREEIKIHAWESEQKAKLEAEMRKMEAQIEQMRAEAQAKMVKKIAMARQKSEEMRAAAEARRDRQAERTAANAEYIRQTGRISSSHLTCCGWS